MTVLNKTFNNVNDLLTTIRKQCLLQNWTEAYFLNGELWLKNPATADNSIFYIGFKIIEDTTINTSALSIKISTSYYNNLQFEDQININPDVFFNLWSNQFDAWIYTNSRRVIVVAKVSTSYLSLYAGMFLPFALPTQYPLPLCVIGNYSKIEQYNVNNSGNRMIADPGGEAAYYLIPEVFKWQLIQNKEASNNVDLAFDAYPVYMFPGNTANYSQRAISYGPGDYFKYLRPNVNDEIPIYQTHIIDITRSQIVGALDGVYIVPGFDKTPEQIINVKNQKFMCFININRSTGKDFFAVEIL